MSAVPLAPAPAPTPFSGGGQAAATVVVGGLALFGLFRALNPDRPDSSDLKIIPLVAEVVEPAPPPPPEPEPIAVAEPEPPPPPPEPEPKPEPVVVAKAEPPRPKPIPKPAPLAAPAPKLESLKPPPPRPAPPPPARRPTPVVKFDAPRPVEEPVEDTRTQWRAVAVEKKAAPAAPKFPKIGIDAVAGPAPAAPPEPPTRVASLPPGAAGPARRPPGPPRFAPPAAPAAALPREDLPPPPAARADVPSLPTTAHGANHALASKKVAFAGAADTDATSSPRGSGPPTRERVAEAPLPSQPQRAEPNQKLRGVPLSSMAACRSDQREDALKLQVIAAVRNRKECSSAAGVYRFVETKNLNAFLLWIERAPGRPAVDRCAELGFALACLKQ